MPARHMLSAGILANNAVPGLCVLWVPPRCWELLLLRVLRPPSPLVREPSQPRVPATAPHAMALQLALLTARHKSPGSPRSSSLPALTPFPFVCLNLRGSSSAHRYLRSAPQSWEADGCSVSSHAQASVPDPHLCPPLPGGRIYTNPLSGVPASPRLKQGLQARPAGGSGLLVTQILLG